MKKIAVFLLITMLLLACSGCANPDMEQKAFLWTEPVSDQLASLWDEPYSDQAPVLKITLGEQSFEVQGSVSNYSKKNLLMGTTEEFLASLVSPLDREYTPIHTQEKFVSFWIDEKPKSMSLKYYKGEALGKSYADFESMLIEPDGDQWPLQKGENIYELWVTWENAVSSRTAQYCFYIVAE